LGIRLRQACFSETVYDDSEEAAPVGAAGRPLGSSSAKIYSKIGEWLGPPPSDGSFREVKPARFCPPQLVIHYTHGTSSNSNGGLPYEAGHRNNDHDRRVLLLGGCATKKYVAKQTDPITAKVNEVEKQAQNTQNNWSGDEPKISAAAEKADSADARAGDALGRADAASKKTDQVKERVDHAVSRELNERIANLDDYKPAG